VQSTDRVHPASATRTARSAITRLTYPIFHRRADHGGKNLGFWPYSWACYSVRVQRVLLLGSRDGV